MGVEVIFVVDGVEVMNVLYYCVCDFDLIIIDCYMLNMDGFDLICIVKKEMIVFFGKLIIGCIVEDFWIVMEKVKVVGIDKIIYKFYLLL